jgi:hypothetical protein
MENATAIVTPDLARAQALARAMALGREDRSFLPPLRTEPRPYYGVPTEVQQSLKQTGDLLREPVNVRSGLLYSLVRLIRRGLRAFLRPWLERQSGYNQDMLQVTDTLFRDTHQELRVLHEYVEQVHMALHGLHTEVASLAWWRDSAVDSRP